MRKIIDKINKNELVFWKDKQNSRAFIYTEEEKKRQNQKLKRRH